MKVWLQKFYRAQALHVIVGVFVLGIRASTASPLADSSNNNNEYYSIVEEHQTCDHIIPKFIEQVMNQKTSICGESGVFPKPGNCSVFFKCVQSDTTIQPFVEYCAAGYNFVNSVCVPNTNSSDCPQYTCRIPDATHSIGNELGDEEMNSNSNDFQSLPLVVPPSSTPAAEESEPIMTTTVTEAAVIKETDSETPNNPPSDFENAMEPMDDHSVQMQMTQAHKNSAASAVIVYNCMILPLIILLL